MIRDDGRRVLVFPTPEEVARQGAELLVQLARAKPGAAVALSGGTTPLLMYDILAGAGRGDQAALRSLVYFFGDERAVPNDHPDSNVRLARRNFLDRIGVPESQLVLPKGGADDLGLEADRLTHLLHERCREKDGPVPALDLIFLGMGSDGHTASLFPGTRAVDSRTMGYEANEVYQLDTMRLTLTFPVLNGARSIVMLVTGQGKAQVLSEIFSHPGRTPAYPVENLPHDRTTWLLDKAAASGIPENPNV